MRSSVLALSFFLLLVSVAARAEGAEVGRPAPDFSLKDTSGRQHSLRAFKGKLVVIGFLGVKCPTSAAYSKRINSLAAEYEGRGVVFLGINSNAHESLAEVRENAVKARYLFPVLKDDSNLAADLYGATVTPEMFVIDASGVLRYHGRVDNASDASRVEREDLRIAINEILMGGAPSKPVLRAFGCQIQRATGKPVAKVSALPDQPRVTPLKPAEFTSLKAASTGKVLVVNFWATWCAPCVAEFPEFVKIHEAYKDKGLRLISISTDETGDIQSAVIPFLKKQNATFETFVSAASDPQDLIDVVDKSWSGALPATFVFDKSGKLVLTKYGIIDREELIKAIEESLR